MKRYPSAAEHEERAAEVLADQSERGVGGPKERSDDVPRDSESLASGAKGRRFESCSARCMSLFRFAPFTAALLALGGCPSSDALPDKLWIGINVNEANIRLVTEEPEPF